MYEEAAVFSNKCLKEIQSQGASLEPEMLAWLLKRLKARWYPRNIEAAAQHLIGIVGQNPFFLYGAGTHSLALLDVLKDHPILKKLTGILDSRARPGQELKGYPVFPAAHALQEREPVIVLSHHEFEDGMRDDLLASGVDVCRIFPIYQNTQYGHIVLKKLLPSLKEQAALLGANQDPIVFVSARTRGIVDNTMAASIKSQCIHLRMDRQDDGQEGEAFQATFNAHNSLFLCLYLLHLLKPRLIYVQEHYSSGNFLPMTLALAFPKCSVIGEFYDFLALTFDDPFILSTDSYWRQEDVQLALAAERWCIRHLHGLVTKEDGPVLDQHLQGARVLKLQPYPDKNLFTSTSPLKDPARLVWAGSIAPSHLSPRMFGDNQLLDVFQKLLQMDFHVTAYSSCRDQAALENLYGDYLALQGPFSIHPALPREALVRKLAQEQDFGLMLGIPKADTQQGISHKVTVSGKLYTYLAAGLPIITGAYLEVMAGWIKQYDLGIVLDTQAIEQLPEFITTANYNRWARNVRLFRESHHLGVVISQLNTFLGGS